MRKERDAVGLYECAFQRTVVDANAANRIIFLRFPPARGLRRVAMIELVDLDQDGRSQLLTSTAAPASQRLALTDLAGHLLLPSPSGSIDISGDSASLRLSLPARIDLHGVGFPALRLIGTDGERLLTLPIVVDVPEFVR